MKTLEGTPNFNHNLEYVGKKRELDELYEQQVEGARIRSKVRDYEHGEKSNKYFLNLEKYHGTFVLLPMARRTDQRCLTERWPGSHRANSD